MDVGVVFPQTEIANEVEPLVEYARTAEELGFHHLSAYDHVVGVHPERTGWDGLYDYYDVFREPLTLFSYFAAKTDRIRFVTGILVLPQRQTALVAKQAAELDVLSGGRFDLGVGVGWNEPEYEALGSDFSTRGRRIEEQVRVLREFWQRETVTFEGDFHSLEQVGLNPLPVQRPIPILFGGTAEPVLRRVGRLGDGWLPQFTPGPEAKDRLLRVYQYARDAGRDPDELTIHGRMALQPGEPSKWLASYRAWTKLDVDRIGVNLIGEGLAIEEHIEQIKEVAEVLPI